MVLKNKKYLIFILFCLIIIIYVIANFDSFKRMLSPYISNNIKQTIKEKIIGKEKLLIMQELYQTRKITNNYNQKTLPETEFTKIFFDKISLRKFDLKTTPSVNNQMFVKPETTTFYLEYIENNILILSNVGKFVFLDGYSFLNNEINESIKPKIEFEEEFFKILDVLTINNKIYFSYAKKIEDGCYKLGLMSSDYNEKKMIFKKIFFNDECGANYAGRLINYSLDEKEGILISLDAIAKYKKYAQDLSSNLGKILFLDLESLSTTIFSIGHRNPQGLYNDNGIVISTEHGPRGGDEINIISRNNNYGWPISSYGEPYIYEKYDKNNYNYLKSHIENGFEEPVYSFVPSIGISQLIKIPKKFNKFWKDDYLITSLNGASIYRTQINYKNDKIIFSEKIFINERIRDIIYIDNLNIVLLALENTGSIGLLKTN
jgi:hypothetical protein